MNFDYLKDKKELVPFALLGVSVLLAILILVKVKSFFATSAQAESIVKKAVAQGEADPNILKESMTDAMKIADGLKRRNLFAPPLPKRNPVSSVLGILGSEALINGKWYKVGDKIGDAKIVAIETTLVRIEWEGQEKTYAPIAAASPAAPKVEVKQPIVAKKEEKVKKLAAGPKPKKVKMSLGPVGEKDPLAWVGGDLPPELRKKMLLKKWNNASDEEKLQAKKQWSRMPEEQKRKAVEAKGQMPKK